MILLWIRGCHGKWIHWSGHTIRKHNKKNLTVYIKQKTKLFSIWNLSSTFFKETPSQQRNKSHTSSLSMAIWTDWICGLSWEPSLMVTEVAMTGRDTPQARPRACLERTNTYGTFLSSQSSGRWRMISSGSASAAITINSAMPLFRVLVAGERSITVKTFCFTSSILHLSFNNHFGSLWDTTPPYCILSLWLNTETTPPSYHWKSSGQYRLYIL